MASIDKTWFKSESGIKIIQSIRQKERIRNYGLLEKPTLSPPFSQYEEVNFKLLLLGKSCCGKTTFIQSINSSFYNKSKINDYDDYVETPGIQITNLYWPVKMTNSDKFMMFNLRFWDVGKLASIKYSYIQPRCFENLDCVIFVFSWTDKQSFMDTYELVKKYSLSSDSDNMVKIIVGTKFDQIIYSSIDTLLVDDIQQIAKTKIINFSSTAEMNFEHISQIMNKISEALWEKRKNANHLKNYDHAKPEVDENDTSDEKSEKTELNKSISVTEKLDILTKTTDDNQIEKPLNSDFEGVEKIDLTSIEDIRKFVTETNKMEMPDDFFEFLGFCKSLDDSDPKRIILNNLQKNKNLNLNKLDALKDIGIELTGLYDLIIGGYKLDYRLHARYFYDPPEFQTVLKVLESPSDLHFGYYRDDPDELPSFVGINEAKLDCKIHGKGDNLFGAINWYIDELISGRNHKSDSSLEEVKDLKSKFDDWCEKLKISKSFSLSLKTPKIKSRDKKVNAKTFHTAGIVVPVDSKGFGYRDIPESYEKQKEFFKNYCLNDSEAGNKLKKSKATDRIQEIITLIQFANDETDYGMGLEFGLNMFGYGNLALHKFIKIILPVCYELLSRSLYAEILLEHLKNRK